MTDTISREAPAATKPKRVLTPEHLAALQKGRDRANAAKSGAAKVHSASPRVSVAKPDLPPRTPSFDAVLTTVDLAAVDALRAELARLKDENAAIKKAAGILSPSEIAQLPLTERYYEFLADKKSERDEPIGERIDSLDAPRWAELFALRHPVVGHVVVMDLVRARSGEILERRESKCVPTRTPQRAHDMMKAYDSNPNIQWY